VSEGLSILGFGKSIQSDKWVHHVALLGTYCFRDLYNLNERGGKLQVEGFAYRVKSGSELRATKVVAVLFTNSRNTAMHRLQTTKLVNWRYVGRRRLE
jgi:hypothetical protein